MAAIGGTAGPLQAWLHQQRWGPNAGEECLLRALFCITLGDIHGSHVSLRASTYAGPRERRHVKACSAMSHGSIYRIKAEHEHLNMVFALIFWTCGP